MEWLPPTELKPSLRQALNSRMNRLGAATAGLGLFSMVLVAAGTFWLVCAWCFLQGFCGGAIDAIANAAISDVHGTGAAPWLQGLHFCFSVGALVAPAAVGELGYQKVFVAFGLLAMPASLASCVADGGDVSDCGWPLNGRGILLEDSDRTICSTASTTTSESDADIMEAAEQRPSYDSLVCEEEADCQQKEELTLESPTTGILPAKNSPTDEQGNQRATPPSAAEVSTLGDDNWQAQQLGESVGAEYMSLDASLPGGIKKAAIDVVGGQKNCQRDRTALLPQKGGTGIPPISLIALLAFFLYLYVGAEVGFGAWIAVVVLRDGLSGEAGAVRMASLFWGGITVGRLLAVPLAVRFSTAFLVRANLLGGLLSSLLLLLAGRVSFAWAALGVGLFGLSMASTFPLVLSLLPSAGFILSGKNASRMVIGGALGEMLMPALIAALMGPDDGVWPAALYAVCVMISMTMIIVYVTCCGLLKAASRRCVG